MNHVVRLGEAEVAELRLLVMDRDAAGALRFLREKVLRPIDAAARKQLDPGKGSHR